MSLSNLIKPTVGLVLSMTALAAHAPLSAAEIAGKLAIPIAIVQDVLAKLLLSRLIAVLKEPEDSDEVYLPAVDIHILTISFVINALEQCGQNQLPEANQQPLLIDAVESFKSMA